MIGIMIKKRLKRAQIEIGILKLLAGVFSGLLGILLLRLVIS